VTRLTFDLSSPSETSGAGHHGDAITHSVGGHHRRPLGGYGRPLSISKPPGRHRAARARQVRGPLCPSVVRAAVTEHLLSVFRMCRLLSHVAPCVEVSGCWWQVRPAAAVIWVASLCVEPTEALLYRLGTLPCTFRPMSLYQILSRCALLQVLRSDFTCCALPVHRAGALLWADCDQEMLLTISATAAAPGHALLFNPLDHLEVVSEHTLRPPRCAHLACNFSSNYTTMCWKLMLTLNPHLIDCPFAG